jgi:CHAT domain-containing protein
MGARKFRSTKSFLFTVISLLFFLSHASAKTISVPEDYTTIREAISAAADGDTIVVNDGFYFEDNVVIDKILHLKSKNRFGAIIQGIRDINHAIFIVQNRVEIEGFVLREAGIGILQRDSLDVDWIAHDLAIMDIKFCGIYINDRETNIGAVSISDSVIYGTEWGVKTNDARGVSMRNSFIVECSNALGGSNHLFFEVDDTIFLNCQNTYSYDTFYESEKFAINIHPNCLILQNIDQNTDQKMLEFIDGQVKSDSLGIFYNVLGEIFIKTKKLQVAEYWFEKGLEAGAALQLDEVRWQALFGLARIEESRKDFNKALDRYQQAINIIEHVRLDLLNQENRINFLAIRTDVYEALIHMLYNQGADNPKSPYGRMAFHYAERIKSRELFDRLRLLEITSNENSGLGTLGSSIDGFDQALTEFELTDLNNAAKTAFIEYLIGKEHGFIWTLSRDRFQMLKLGDLNNIREMTENYVQFITADKKKPFDGKKGGQLLYQEILQPVLENLNPDIDHLVIIPDGFLFQLPFATLISENQNSCGSDKKEIYLIEKYKISYASSLSTLKQIQRLPQPTSAKKILFVANNSKQILTKKGSGQWIFARPSKSGKTAQRKEEQLTMILPSLKKVKNEINSVAGLFGKTETTVLWMGNESEADFMSLLKNRFEIIHFAVHGIYDHNDWRNSCLILAPEKSLGSDGFLQPSEISRSDIRSDLIVLSACHSGEGRFMKGEGILGFLSAFQYAGARSVISSLWEIDDEAAMRLMNIYYKNLSLEYTKAEALQNAKCVMIDSEFCNPYYWSPFILYGDYGPILVN